MQVVPNHIHNTYFIRGKNLNLEVGVNTQNPPWLCHCRYWSRCICRSHDDLNAQWSNTPTYVWKNIILPFNSLKVGQTWVKYEMQIITDFVNGDGHNLSEHVQGTMTDENMRFGRIDYNNVSTDNLPWQFSWDVMNFFFRGADKFLRRKTWLQRLRPD